jgi:hypothetical protein
MMVMGFRCHFGFQQSFLNGTSPAIYPYIIGILKATTMPATAPIAAFFPIRESGILNSLQDKCSGEFERGQDAAVKMYAKMKGMTTPHIA